MGRPELDRVDTVPLDNLLLYLVEILVVGGSVVSGDRRDGSDGSDGNDEQVLRDGQVLSEKQGGRNVLNIYAVKASSPYIVF